MMAIPLFSRNELADAFSLLMSRAESVHWADEWFARFTHDDNIDNEGRYLYEDWTADYPLEEPAILAGRAPGGTFSSPGYDFRFLKSEHDLGEFLMRFSDFNLNLLSLSSPILFERIRAALGDSPAAAARKRTQMQEIVEAIRARRS